METWFHLDQRRVNNVVDTSAQKHVDVSSGPQRRARTETLNECICTFDTSIAFDEDRMFWINFILSREWGSSNSKILIQCWPNSWGMVNVTVVVVFADRLCSLYCFSFGLFQVNSFSVFPPWKDIVKVIEKCDWMFRCRQSGSGLGLSYLWIKDLYDPKMYYSNQSASAFWQNIKQVDNKMHLETLEYRCLHTLLTFFKVYLMFSKCECKIILL